MLFILCLYIIHQPRSELGNGHDGVVYLIVTVRMPLWHGTIEEAVNSQVRTLQGVSDFATHIDQQKPPINERKSARLASASMKLFLLPLMKGLTNCRKISLA